MLLCVGKGKNRICGPALLASIHSEKVLSILSCDWLVLLLLVFHHVCSFLTIATAFEVVRPRPTETINFPKALRKKRGGWISFLHIRSWEVQEQTNAQARTHANKQPHKRTQTNTITHNHANTQQKNTNTHTHTNTHAQTHKYTQRHKRTNT